MPSTTVDDRRPDLAAIRAQRALLAVTQRK
jgi:hypothetical protein